VRDGKDARQAQGDKNSSSRLAVGWLCVFGVQNDVCPRYKIIMTSSVIETWPRTKTGQSDEQQVTNLVLSFAVESII